MAVGPRQGAYRGETWLYASGQRRGRDYTLEREPFLPRLQNQLRRHAARLHRSPPDRARAAPDDDDRGAAEPDRARLRTVRPSSLLTGIPTSCRANPQ